MEIKIQFSQKDAISIFENAGMNVKLRDMPFLFKSFNGITHEEMIPVYTVKNPYTGEYEDVSKLFQKFIENKKRDIFLNPDKLEVFNLFKKQKNETTMG